MHRLVRHAAIALLATAIGCSFFPSSDDLGGTSTVAATDGGEDIEPDATPTPTPTPTSDAMSEAESPADAADTRRFCDRATHTFCVDFDMPPVTTQWTSVERADVGTVAYDGETGATTPGSLVVTTTAFTSGGALYDRTYLLRRLDGLASGQSYRFEISFRADELPDVGTTDIARLIMGNALFYIGLSHQGYHLLDGYFGTACGAGPCGGAEHFGTKAIPLGKWDTITVTITKPDAGRHLVVLSSKRGTELTFEASSVFIPQGGDFLVSAGISVATGSTMARKLHIDDVALDAFK